MLLVRTAVVAIVMATQVAVSAAQPSFLLDRGEELERLDRLVGRWEGELTRAAPGGGKMDLRPVVEFSWDVGGVWLRGRDRTRLPNGDVVENMTWMTWHARDDVYHGAWHDNVYPSFVKFTATWEDNARLVLDSGVSEINGRAHRIVQTYTFTGNDSYRTEMRQSWDDGPLETVATAVYRRTDGEE